MNELFNLSKLNANIILVISSLTKISETVNSFLNSDKDLSDFQELETIINDYNEGSEKVAASVASFVKIASGINEIDLESSENGFKI